MMPKTGFEWFILALVPFAIAALLWTWLEGRGHKGKDGNPSSQSQGHTRRIRFSLKDNKQPPGETTQ